MAIDYKETLAYADFIRENIWPNIRHITKEPIDFTQYLAGLYPKQTFFSLPLAHVFSLEWLLRFKDKCVSFYHNNPDAMKNGAPPLSVIYQFSRRLHGLANVGTWREAGENDGQVMAFLVYENFSDVEKFLRDNEDIFKKPKKEKPVGFNILESETKDRVAQ